MDFSFNDEQLLLQDTVRRFLSENYGFDERRGIVGSATGQSREIWRALAELGLLGLIVPDTEGGLGGSATEALLVSSAMGEALAVEPFLASAVIATRAVAVLGSPERQRSLFVRMMSGDLVVVLAYDHAPRSEHVSVVRATSEGGRWRLDGRVPVVYHAPAADVLLVPAITGSQGDRYDALFAIPPSVAGLTMTPYVTVDSQPAADLILGGVRADASMRIDTGRAFPDDFDFDATLEAVSDFAIMALCADALGALEKTLLLTVEYTRTRQQFGGPIARFQALQHRMVDMLMRIEQTRSVVYLAATNCDAASFVDRASAVSAAKVLVSDACRFVGQQAVQLHGGMGMADESSVSHYFKRLLAAEVRFGSVDSHISRFAGLATPN